MAGTKDNFENTIQLTLSGTIAAGSIRKVQGIVGLYPVAGVSGDKVPFMIEGKIKGATKAGGTGLGWTAGQVLYYESSGNSFTTASTGNTKAAIAAADATAAATTGDVILLGVI